MEAGKSLEKLAPELTKNRHARASSPHCSPPVDKTKPVENERLAHGVASAVTGQWKEVQGALLSSCLWKCTWQPPWLWAVGTWGQLCALPAAVAQVAPSLSSLWGEDRWQPHCGVSTGWVLQSPRACLPGRTEQVPTCASLGLMPATWRMAVQGPCEGCPRI